MNRKIALVTGASRWKGIGKAICCDLARKGFDVFFTYWTAYDDEMPWGVDPKEPERIQRTIQQLGVRCSRLELDLTSENATQRLMKKVKEDLGSPTVLINNATYSTSNNIENLTSSDLDKHYELNIKASILLTQAFIKQFESAGNGRIINLTSGQSLGPMPNEIAYAISKGAIETLCSTLSQTLAAKGITINNVNPGPNDTGWMSDETKQQLLKQFPMKRLGTPKDTAKLIGFLASDEASWITGQTIHSEGGFIR